jgi:hypothetical protein
MKILRKIIKEEIEKILSESIFYGESPSETFLSTPSSKDDIIYNYNLGYSFANNSLQSDINNLNKYTLTEYLPVSINKESWSFEFETTMGIILIVDIIRIIRGGKSFWSITFATQTRDYASLPEKENELENIEGYDNFVKLVNNTISRQIDPSKF